MSSPRVATVSWSEPHPATSPGAAITVSARITTRMQDPARLPTLPIATIVSKEGYGYCETIQAVVSARNCVATVEPA